MKRMFVLVCVLGLATVSQAVLVDDYEGYGIGALPDVAVPPYSTTEAAFYADIMVDPLDAGNQVISYYGSGDYRDTKISTPVSISTTGVLSFDVLVNAETGVDNAFGLTHNEGMSWYSDYGPYVRVTENAVAGTVGLDTRDGGGFVDDIAALNVGQWYNIKLDIDTADGGSFDIYLDDALIYSDSGFRFGFAGDPLDNFCLMAAASAAQGNVMVDNVDIVPEPATMLLLGLGGLLMRRCKQ